MQCPRIDRALTGLRGQTASYSKAASVVGAVYDRTKELMSSCFVDTTLVRNELRLPGPRFIPVVVAERFLVRRIVDLFHGS